MKLHIGFDLDGVLVDFNTGFLRVLQEIEGVPRGPVGDLRDPRNLAKFAPDTWGWPKSLGFSKLTIDVAWAHASEPQTQFWRRLQAIHPYEQTSRLVFELTHQDPTAVEVHFVTSRPGPAARSQSIEWLKAHGAPGNVSVLVCGRKGHLAHALGLDLVVDDHLSNALDVLERSDARVGLVETAYNLAWSSDVPRARRTRLDAIRGGLPGLAGYLKTVGALPPSFTLAG